MVNMSIFSIVWTFISFIFVILTLHTLLVKPKSRVRIISQLCSYGKTSITFPGYPKLLTYFLQAKVDKGKNFKNFYLFAMVNFVTLYFLIYIQDSRTCRRIINLLLSSKEVTGNNINLEVKHISVRHMILTVMLLLQLTRRFYECHFVAVANKKGSYIHVTHLALGYFFYANLNLLVIYSGMKERVRQEEGQVEEEEEDFSPVLTLLGIVIFTIGSWIQYSSHVTLAKVRLVGRKAGFGEYQLPSEGFFSLVSCPNYFGEIVIYVGFASVSGFDGNFLSLLAFVSALHSQAALASHEWYKSQFSKNFPVNRKALIPFLFLLF